MWRRQCRTYELRQFAYEEHSVNVVKVAVLSTTIVNILTTHAEFGVVEDSAVQSEWLAMFFARGEVGKNVEGRGFTQERPA